METAAYGAPASLEVILAEGFEEETGLTYTALIYADNYAKPLKDMAGKPRALATDFFSSLVEGPDNRWYFSGVLNGWDGLTSLELVRLTDGKQKQLWSSTSQGPPEFPKSGLKGSAVTALLRRPDYTANGYTKDVEGYLWWADARKDGTVERFTFGDKALEQMQNENDKGSKAVRVHHFGHRWGRKGKRETFMQRIEYHTGILVEWDHGEYVTLVEKTWLNGMGGAKGHSQWLEDTFKDETPSLFTSLAPTMRVPFTVTRSEIRLFDLPMKSVAEFKAFMAKHTGLNNRIVAPMVRYSSGVKADIDREELLQSLLTYTKNQPLFKNPGVTGAGSNCQTLSTDLFGYLTVQKKALTFSLAFRPIYSPHQNWFHEQ